MLKYTNHSGSRCIIRYIKALPAYSHLFKSQQYTFLIFKTYLRDREDPHPVVHPLSAHNRQGYAEITNRS